MSSKILFLVEPEVEDLELFYPLFRLKEAGYQPVVASTHRGNITGKHGYTIMAEKAYDEVDHGEYLGLVLPGGRSPEKVRLNQDAVKIVRGFVQRDAPIGAICHGPQILISANAVKGKRMTCWPGVRDDLIAAGANYSDVEVVTDGKLVTSRMPADLPAFTSSFIDVLKTSTSKSILSTESKV
ncbi:MAG: type 1 glutamine amidotransferase [Nitrososphaerota archaeon]|nr:type 1 glutamine amidotransferase [Nitrososphaerota archaeon]